MNNFIIINRTYSEITPESAEQGDFSDCGLISEHEQVSFSQLVDLMKTHYQPSCSPATFENNHIWFSTGFYIDNYYTGTEREECIHFHSDNSPNIKKYWKLAFIAANKKK